MQNKTQKQTKEYPVVLCIVHQIPYAIQWHENNNKHRIQYPVIYSVVKSAMRQQKTSRCIFGSRVDRHL